jgi:hypothetical protein
MTAARWDRYPDRASARRAAAWALHPDRGGDAAAFAAALASIDEAFSSRPVTVRRRGGLRRVIRRRRYIQL